ncbi:MAG: branched-chain amino acid transport system / permease component family protein [Hyphomicrobiales bacterium]|nr:branched-chain amino acid transport system / permease component family protein [Hyphomicrobiales bacterium]
MTKPSSIAYALVALLAVALIPLLGGPYLTSFVFALLISFVLAQSWDWVNGQMGYLNLGHYAFYGIGAYAFAILLTRDAGLAVSFAGAVAFATLAALLVSFPLFRLKGDYFAFATLAIVPLCELLANNLDWLTKGSDGITLPPHYVLVPAFYAALGLAALTLLVTLGLMRSRFGYALRAIRNDEQVAEVAGVRLFPVKAAMLAVSAAFAGLAGAIQAWQFSFIDPFTMFNLGVALVPIAGALLGGSGLLMGPLLGVILFASLQQLLLVNITHLQGALLGLVIVLIGRFLPGGLLRWKKIAAHPAFAWLARESHFEREMTAGGPAAGALPISEAVIDPERIVLQCEAATMAFGGNVAVNRVNLTVRQGEIVGLVGPNGSGKTTLFNLISGIYTPKSGRIRIDGRDIAGLRADEIAHLGVGRSYQIPRPFGELTVRENIAIGRTYGRHKTALPDAMEAADSIAAFVGLGDKLETRADHLSLQQKKALELARALASEPKLLLVDEVASGLSTVEINLFVQHIRAIRDRYGITVIWVEHIFSALSQVVDRLVVLESGSVIADAPLAEAVRDENVLRTYLGSAHGDGRTAEARP